jgi:hypothetical protein
MPRKFTTKELDEALRMRAEGMRYDVIAEKLQRRDPHSLAVAMRAREKGKSFPTPARDNLGQFRNRRLPIREKSRKPKKPIPPAKLDLDTGDVHLYHLRAGVTTCGLVIEKVKRADTRYNRGTCYACLYHWKRGEGNPYTWKVVLVGKGPDQWIKMARSHAEARAYADAHPLPCRVVAL